MPTQPTGNEFLDDLQQHGGYWRYSGGRYLAKLTSGLVSDVFANCSVITSSPRLLGKWVPALWQHFRAALEANIDPPLVFIGPAQGGITLAYELARFADMYSYQAHFTEPVYGLFGPREIPEQSWAQAEVREHVFKERAPIQLGSTAFAVEDVVTTGKSTFMLIDAVNYATFGKLKFVPFVLCLIDRRPYVEGPLDRLLKGLKPGDPTLRVVSLARIEGRTWPTLEAAQRDCPNVIEAVRPKSRQEWARLLAG